MSRGCRIIGFVRGIPRFKTDQLWEDIPVRENLLVISLVKVISFVQQDIWSIKSFGP